MSSQDIEWLLKEKYQGEKSDAFFADCKRLALGEPLGYIIGSVPFLNTTIHLDTRPLIPRPETEFWTEKAIEQINRIVPKEPRILDLCAGSGCIGTAVAKAIPSAHLVFSEIDKKHIPLIEKNLLENEISSNRTTVIHTGLFKDVTGTFDFILSNPPYIDSDLHRVDESVFDFEPHLALFGGKGGIEVIANIIKTSPEYLNPNGQLWIEHEPEQSIEIAELATASGFTVTTHTDQYGVDRFSILVHDLNVTES